MAKHIFVTGGVVSSLGKGITAASLGHLLKARGYKVTMQKMDPYLNVDPGTMSPFQHGEVFVTDDGHEGDLDLGHYERFIDESLSRESNFTQGSIYQTLIARERRGDFLGGTVQVIPHVTEAIKERLRRIASQSNADIVISEIGGTIGDIESQPFIEAARQFKKEKDPGDVLFVHVTLVPYIAAAHEVKTKPTQHSVKELRSIGVQPDFIVCRSDHEITDKVREKIALFCDVATEDVLACVDSPSIYEVPLALDEQGFDVKVLDKLGLEVRPIDLTPLKSFLEAADNCEGQVRHCGRGQVRSASGRVSLRHRGARACGRPRGTPRGSAPYRWRGAHRRQRRGDARRRWTAFSCRAASVSAPSRGRSPQRAMPACTRFRSSASAWGFRRRYASLPAMLPVCREPRRPNSTSRRNTP